MLLRLFIPLVLSLGLAAPASAISFSFAAIINEAQEVPPTGSPALGLMNLNYDNVTHILQWTAVVATNLLLGPETDTTVNVGAPGVNGPALFSLGTGFLKIGAVDLDFAAGCPSIPVCEAALLANDLYVQVASDAFPDISPSGGEIRGQLEQITKVAPTPEPGTMLLLGAGGLGLWLIGRRKS